MYLLILLQFLMLSASTRTQDIPRLGKFEEVFAWKQLTYNIDGNILSQDTFSGEGTNGSELGTRYSQNIYFNDDNQEDDRNLNERPINTESTTNIDPNDEIGRFFVQYNNVPFGAERVGSRLFVTVPRRRYGIPSTLNYIDLARADGARSPPLVAYPDVRRARTLVSVYRTRADECGRLWMVDTGAIEIPNNTQQMQPPAIVVFDLNTDAEILRYQLKSSDIPAANTPTGLASISVLVKNGDCTNTYAYIPDVMTYGLIVYSLRDNDSWRHSHNYFHFNPTAGNLRVAGQSFQWNDGVFSVAIGAQDSDGCAVAYFHPMVSRQEFSVSTCVLENRVTNQTAFNIVGDRGENSQSTMHGLHTSSDVMFFAEIGRDAVTCWRAGTPLATSNIAVLAQDEDRISYPTDLHITGNEVWILSNSLPRFIYSRLDTNRYNFYVYKANVRDLVAGTVCARSSPTISSSSSSLSSPYYRGTGV